MTNPKWGTKRQCQECGARFYDLKKTKIVCPACDAAFTVEAPPKPKRAIATPAKAEAPKAEAPKAAAEETTAAPAADEPPISEEEKALKELEVEVPDDESEEGEDKASFEDASELGEDEDDVNEVIVDSKIATEET